MVSINLSDDLVSSAKKYAVALSRSTPKQIEHWARIGKIAEDNPDLSHDFIKGILLALQEEDSDLEPYKFGEED